MILQELDILMEKHPEKQQLIANLKKILLLIENDGVVIRCVEEIKIALAEDDPIKLQLLENMIRRMHFMKEEESIAQTKPRKFILTAIFIVFIALIIATFFLIK